MVRRGNLEIAADVISIVAEGTRKTHIMFKANLSYSLVNTALHALLKAGLLEAVGGDYMAYRTTEKGREFLDCYNNMQQLMGNSRTKPVYEMYLKA